MADTDQSSNGIVKAKKTAAKATLKPATLMPVTPPFPPVPSVLAASPAVPVKAAPAKRGSPATKAGTVAVRPAVEPVTLQPNAAEPAAPQPAAPQPIASQPAAVPPSAPSPELIAAAPVISTPTPPAAIAAVPAPKETIMDLNTAPMNDAVEKTQAMFGDVNERAKGAMEKGTKMIEELNAFGKGNIEAIVESSKIAAKGMETMGHDAAAYAKKSYEGASDAMKTLATAKSPTEFMRLQSDYIRTAFDLMIAETSRSTEAMMKLSGEIAQPISNRVAIAKAKLPIAA